MRFLQSLRQQPQRGGAIQLIQPGENNESLVRAIGGILPALEDLRIEEIRHQTVDVKKPNIFELQHAGPLKLRQTFQFILRESVEEIQNEMTTRRVCGSKKGTDQRRARGDSCQK